MACFHGIETNKIVIHIVNSIAYFSDPLKNGELLDEENVIEIAKHYFHKDSRDANVIKFYLDLGVLEAKFKESENLERSYVMNMIGMTLLELQTFLETKGGSVLAPISSTKTNYVYVEGQRDYDGSRIG